VLGLPGRLHLPGLPAADETPEEYARRYEELKQELTAEIMDEKGLWKKIAGRKNDFGDCLKYAIAAFDYLRPDLEAERAARAGESSTPAMDGSGKIGR
jgi:phage terminase large subunit GpA-like protein